MKKEWVFCCCCFCFCFFHGGYWRIAKRHNRQRDFESNGERRCGALISLAVCSGCCCHCDNMTAKTNYREQGSGMRVYLIVKPDIVAPLLNLTDYLTQLITSWLFCLSVAILLMWPTRLLAEKRRKRRDAQGYFTDHKASKTCSVTSDSSDQRHCPKSPRRWERSRNNIWNSVAGLCRFMYRMR